jgi:uncharacterized protein (DUF983 family)
MTLVVGSVVLPPARSADSPHPAPMPEVRCPQCRRLLFKGILLGEIRCERCGALVKFQRGVS